MNHAQCYDGEKLDLKSGELIAEIPLEQAHAEMAGAVAAFLTVTSQKPGSKNSDNARARNILKAKVDVGQKGVLTFGKALDEQADGVEEMQALIAGGSSLTAENVTVLVHTDMNIFKFYYTYVIGGRVIVPIYFNGVNNSYDILKNLWVKFRSREAILKDFHDAGLSKVDSAEAISSARKLNEKTFETALKLVTDEYRQKYILDGRKLRFIDDLMMDNVNDWNANHPVIKPTIDDKVPCTDHCSVVSDYSYQSPVYKSGDDLYMKLISLGRAMTWIYVDAFRCCQKYLN